MCSSAGLKVVGRIEINPANAGTKNREPRVRGIGADETRLACGRPRAQVAAHVTRGQAERTQAGDAEVREILADAAPFFPDFVQGRGDGGRFGIVGEILEDAAGQVAHGGEERSSFAKTFTRVIGKIEGGARLG